MGEQQVPEVILTGGDVAIAVLILVGVMASVELLYRKVFKSKHELFQGSPAQGNKPPRERDPVDRETP